MAYAKDNLNFQLSVSICCSLLTVFVLSEDTMQYNVLKKDLLKYLSLVSTVLCIHVSHVLGAYYQFNSVPLIIIIVVSSLLSRI